MILSRVIGSHQRRAVMLPCIISQGIVKYLHEVKGFSLEEIANITSMSVKDIELILKGSKTFSPKNIKSLIEKYDETMISVLSEACSEEHLPDKLKKNVILYKHLQQVKKKIPK